MNIKWTIVQHSAWAGKHDPQFKQGLETAMLQSATEVTRVVKAGGIVFDSYNEAEDFAEKAMYPPGAVGLIPRAAGTFSDKEIGRLRIYIPVRVVTG